MHLKNIFDEGELEENRTIKDFLIVQKEGKRNVKRKQILYNLDAIIAVGYRIKTNVATQFRLWATQRLKEYLIQGYTVNKQRLNQLDPCVLGVKIRFLYGFCSRSSIKRSYSILKSCDAVAWEPALNTFK